MLEHTVSLKIELEICTFHHNAYYWSIKAQKDNLIAQVCWHLSFVSRYADRN